MEDTVPPLIGREEDLARLSEDFFSFCELHFNEADLLLIKKAYSYAQQMVGDDYWPLGGVGSFSFNGCCPISC